MLENILNLNDDKTLVLASPHNVKSGKTAALNIAE